MRIWLSNIAMVWVCYEYLNPKERGQKKMGLCGKNSQVADPPHTPTPQFGKSLLWKKSWVYFSFYNLSNIFGLHQKITILNKLNRHQEVGLGRPPPPHFGNFSHIIPFFFMTTTLIKNASKWFAAKCEYFHMNHTISMCLTVAMAGPL